MAVENEEILLNCTATIHKNDVCLRQKSPKPMDTSFSSVFHAGHKYGLHFEIEATFLALFKFSHLLQDL